MFYFKSVSKIVAVECFFILLWVLWKTLWISAPSSALPFSLSSIEYFYCIFNINIIFNKINDLMILNVISARASKGLLLD